MQPGTVARRGQCADVTGADPSGRYIVGRAYPGGGGYQAVIWQGGGVREVPLPGDVGEGLADVNSAGVAVGWGYVGSGGDETGRVPYAYRDGRVSKLPGVRRGSANAINDAGAVVGDDGARNALVWPSLTTDPVRLPLPPGAGRATAEDIDEDGTTVGNLDGERPYVWFPDGTHRELPMPTLDGVPAGAAQAFTIRNGWATGVATTANLARLGVAPETDPGTDAPKVDRLAGTRAVRWNVRTGEVRIFESLEGRAGTANAHGWQIGKDSRGRAVLVTDSATVVLPDLHSHRPGALANVPTTLSDDGRIIGGQADDARGTIQAVVWRCE